ncbi:22209_t:CDS:2, partial [Gigaspora margarita]
DTLPVLNRQLEEIQKKSDIEIKICKDTVYCFDNESFRFLAAVKKGIIFTDKENFLSSWEKSANESVRLFQYIKNQELQKEDITADELKNKLYIPTIELKITLLDRPKVECTKSSCKKNAE